MTPERGETTGENGAAAGAGGEPGRLPRNLTDWRWVALAAVWGLVGLRLVVELGGRGAEYWQADLITLFGEQASFHAGVYPHYTLAPTAPGTVLLQTAYPPFSLPLFLPWLPPGLGLLASRVWFTGCQLGALALILAFAWRQGRAGGRGLGWLLAGSVLAMSGVRSDLLFGNVALIATALVVVCQEASRRGYGGGAAVAWVASMVKPQIGWLFGLNLLRAGNWRAGLGGGAVLAISAAGACLWTGVTPAQIVRSGYGGDLSSWTATMELNNLVTLASKAGVPAGVGLAFFAALGVGVTLWLLRGRLAAEGLQCFAVIALINRLCTYHNHCDDVLLVFPLVWLGRRAWCGGTRGDGLMFAVLGVSVWLPAMATSHLPVRVLVLLTWLLVTAWIATRRPEAAASADGAVRGAEGGSRRGMGVADRRLPGIWFGVILLAFSAAVLPTVGEGVGSWDSHKIQVAVRALLDDHVVMLSRPPGHPVTDFYLFGGIGWLLEETSGWTFNTTVFLTMQWAAALAVAGVFYAWLRRTGVAAGRAVLAVACLLFSPQFLDQTVNGEEIILGLLFLFGSAVVLAHEGEGAVKPGRLAAAIVLFALATGCRAEFVLCGFIFFPVYFLRRGVRDGKTWLLAVAGAVAVGVVIWLPVIPVILRDGTRAGDVADIWGVPSLLVWGYKVMFRSYGFPASLVLVAVFALGLYERWRSRRAGKRRDDDWTALVCVAVVIVYLALFLFQPGKPAYVLVGLPFLLWLTAQRSIGWLVAVAGLTGVGLFFGVDLFRGRVLTKPHLVEGAYQAAVRPKPARQLGYVSALAKVDLARKSVIVGDAWSWVYEYHIARGTLPAEAREFGADRARGFVIGGDVNRVMVPREATFRAGPLRQFHHDGYEIVMDRVLWRTLYARYEVTMPAGDRATIGRIPVRLVDVDVKD